ncbi:hypothetical protein [Gemmatimonas sp.]|uniref:hypothetical protein n=1 Tax=Gemmatimonas sp. TaxID=1962908 RepID=UPI00286E9BED|nr:hypothetical protein [Gemmatimonas sp.]
MGRAIDGGYVMPGRAVVTCTHLVGMGISDDWSFEEDVLRRNPSIRLLAIDGSVSATRFGIVAVKTLLDGLTQLVSGNVAGARRALLESKWSAATAVNFYRFFSSNDRRFVKKMVSAEPSPNGITWRGALARLSADSGQPRSILVKVDIEGGEYSVLPEILGSAKEIVAIIVEFHDCGKRWKDFETAIAQVTGMFTVVHVHGNNYMPLIPGTQVPEVLEITFLRSDLLTAEDFLAAPFLQYPVAALDMPNDASKKDYPLTFE